MTQSPTCTWQGKSGTNYTYYIHALWPSFNTDQPGNYIFCKKNVQGRWVPIYIGQGDLGQRVSKNHHQYNCITSKGATHVHVHTNSIETARTNEESDLLANYTNAYAPNGCNEKIGG